MNRRSCSSYLQLVGTTFQTDSPAWYPDVSFDGFGWIGVRPVTQACHYRMLWWLWQLGTPSSQVVVVVVVVVVVAVEHIENLGSNDSRRKALEWIRRIQEMLAGERP